MSEQYSLLIGRWQPFHQGHQALVQKVLDEGNLPLIAIRDTEVSEDNPWSANDRREAILTVFPQVKVIIIPDIKEVVYGRKVGWGIREIRLDGDLEAISGTKSREEMRNKGLL